MRVRVLLMLCCFAMPEYKYYYSTLQLQSAAGGVLVRGSKKNFKIVFSRTEERSPHVRRLTPWLGVKHTLRPALS